MVGLQACAASSSPIGSVTKLAVGQGGLPSNFPQQGDLFGFSANLIGDMDGDGVNDLGIHVHQGDGTSSSTGTFAILYMSSDGTVDRFQEYWLGTGGNIGGSAVGQIGAQFGADPTRVDQPLG